MRIKELKICVFSIIAASVAVALIFTLGNRSEVPIPTLSLEPAEIPALSFAAKLIGRKDGVEIHHFTAEEVEAGFTAPADKHVLFDCPDDITAGINVEVAHGSLYWNNVRFWGYEYSGNEVANMEDGKTGLELFDGRFWLSGKEFESSPQYRYLHTKDQNGSEMDMIASKRYYLMVDGTEEETFRVSCLDTDNGGLNDGVEDINGNGQIDEGETDPSDPRDDVVASLAENKLVCELNPETGKENLCYCKQPEHKSKSAVVIKKDGSFDEESLTQKIIQYLESVQQDVDVMLAEESILRFEGKTKEEFMSFLGNAYDEQNVAYVVIVGDDLPILEKLVEHCPEGDCEGIEETQTFLDKDGLGEVRKSDDNPEFSCKEQVISLVMPPLEYSEEEKKEFVSDILDRMSEFHTNPDAVFNGYRNELLGIHYFDEGTPLGDFVGINPIFPVYETYNTNQIEVRQKISERPIVTAYHVHGHTSNNTMGLVEGRIEVFIDDWISFAEENPDPTFFIHPHACQSFGVGEDGRRECCWPQIFMKTGAYAFGKITENFFDEPFIGKAYQRDAGGTNVIFGDQFIHFPSGTRQVGTVRGIVVDKETGNPMENIAVSINFGEENTSWTAADGSFEISGIPAGRVIVFVDSPPQGYNKHSEFVDVEDKSDQTIEIGLQREEKEEEVLIPDLIDSKLPVSLHLVGIGLPVGGVGLECGQTIFGGEWCVPSGDEFEDLVALIKSVYPDRERFMTNQSTTYNVRTGEEEPVDRDRNSEDILLVSHLSPETTYPPDCSGDCGSIENTGSCSDSDKGKITAKPGYARAIFSSQPIVMFDMCLSGSWNGRGYSYSDVVNCSGKNCFHQEAFCTPGGISTERKYCPDGCLNGSCENPIEFISGYHCDWDDDECNEGDTCWQGICVPIPQCGNDHLDHNEQCDDGNRINNDGCDSDCKNEVSCDAGFGVACCDNGILEAGEQCGDGWMKNHPTVCTGPAFTGYACKDCRCVQMPPGCGDNNIQEGEECDKGHLNGLECDVAYWTSIPTEFQRRFIECEYCSDECLNVHLNAGYCGDEIVQEEREQCDDGNNDDGDGCSARCQNEG